MRTGKGLSVMAFATTVLTVLCNAASATDLENFDPDRHHFLLVTEGHPRVKRSLPTRENDFSNETARIYACHIQTDIRYRYAQTQVTSEIINRNKRVASEVVFTMVLPEAAFISKFLMIVNEKVYTAYVKAKEEARKIYTDAQNRGFGAGLVEVNARHANVFTVNLNVQPSSRVTLNLTYEEFLTRKLGNYEHVIHIRPEQISKIPDFKISVTIFESQNLTRIQVPKLVTNESPAHYEENESAQISQPAGNYATITWRPSPSDQKLGNDGIKFVAHYDIKHESGAGEILLKNGYFVHFFAPSNIPSLRKHVVYVLDVSGSMNGRRMDQMKQVMRAIIDDLKQDDYFNIITFSTKSTIAMSTKSADLTEPTLATDFHLREAHKLLNSLEAGGWTNIDAALKDALTITSHLQLSSQRGIAGTLPQNVESLIMFLTDGDPTEGVKQTDTIVSNAKNRNLAKVPIYAISFGLEPDFGFLKKLSLENFGFARKIYEGADAGIQMNGFYKEISSPLLSNLKFKYTTNSNSTTVQKLTKQSFPIISNGSEIVIAGYINDKNQTSYASTSVPPTFLTVDIDANGRNGNVTLSGDDLTRNPHDLLPSQNQSRTFSTGLEDKFLERLWAYITIKQLLEIPPGHNATQSDDDYDDYGDEEELQNGETARDRALRLALKYGFVTPITSLVVVKPEEPLPLDSSTHSNKSEVVNVVDLVEATAPTGQSVSVLPTMSTGTKLQASSPTFFLPTPTPYSPYKLFKVTTTTQPFVFKRVSLYDTSLYASVMRETISDDAEETEDPAVMNRISHAERLLATISWPILKDSAGNSFLMVQGTKYYIVGANQEIVQPRSQNKCSGGTRHRRFQGTCQHLRDCVPSQIKDDFQKYVNNFFCEMSVNGLQHAGVCCTVHMLFNMKTVT